MEEWEYDGMGQYGNGSMMVWVSMEEWEYDGMGQYGRMGV